MGLAVAAAMLPARMSQVCSQSASDGWFLQGNSDLHHFEEVAAPSQNLVLLVVDTSGSMKTVTERASLVAQQLRLQGYAVGLVSYADHARFQMQPTEDLQALQERIMELPIGGASNLGSGLLAAIDWYKLTDQRGGIVLISDGQANSGLVDERAILLMAADAGLRGLPIFTSQENGLLIGLSTESYGSSIEHLVHP